jgi:N-acetylneuraminic acid mutarotase
MYVFGGANSTVTYNTLRIYDSVANTWSAGASDGNIRYAHSAVAIGTKMYVLGCQSVQEAYTYELRIYDSETNTWSDGAIFGYSMSGHSATAIGTKMYVFGGAYGGTVLPALRSYDTLTNTWSTETTNTRRTGHSAVTIDANMYVFGGNLISGGGYLNTLEMYDPDEVILEVGDPAYSDGLPAYDPSESIQGTKIYILGGVTDAGLATNILSVYDTETLEWTRLTSYPGGPICNHTAVFINDKMYVCGGQDKDPSSTSITYYSELYVYTPATDTWVQKSGFGHVTDHVALAYDGKMYVAGGY